MLEHVGEALTTFVAFWRFVLSRGFRERKLTEWRDARPTMGGKAVIVGEILAATVIGVLLPLWLVLVVLTW